MLTEIKLKNFKAVEEPNAVSLAPLTVLIGRNSSGKSSLVESLDWLGLAVHDGAIAATEAYQRIGDVIGKWSAEGQRYFEIALKLDPMDISVGGQVAYTIRVGEDENRLPVILYEDLRVLLSGEETVLIRTEEGTRLRHISVALSGKQDIIQHRERADRKLQTKGVIEFGESWLSTSEPDRLALCDIDPGKDRAGGILKEFLEKAVFLRLNPRSIAMFSPLRMAYSPRLLDDQGYELARLLGELDAETLEILIEKLSFIIQGASTLQTHEPAGPADRRYFELAEARSGQEQTVAIPAWMLSEGTRRVTAILAVLLHDDPPPLLCIEEVENGLDPWTLKYLLDELAGAVGRGTQIILTTHSPYLLNLLPLECMILCERNATGVHFLSGASLPDLGEIQNRMGPGDLYANSYLHEISSEVTNG